MSETFGGGVLLATHYRDELDEPTAREFDALYEALRAWMAREHNVDGTHNFPDFTEGAADIDNTINAIIDRYQARGQYWYYGPWVFNKASDPRAGRAWLRPPNPSGTLNDYAPSGIDTAIVLELEPDSATTITGIKAREGLHENRLLIIRNRDSGASLTITHEDSGSLASNRFDITGDDDIILGPRQSVWCLYDTGRERWAVIVTGMTQGPISDSSPSSTSRKAQLDVILDGNGATLTTGAKKVYARVPYDFEILGWDIVLDQSGSIVLDVWYDTYANFPPTVADTITASAKPTVSTAQKATSSTLTGWTTSLVEGRYLEINVDSVSTATKAILSLWGRKVN